ncbi:MAG: PQQ-binding-like beta-propeller repeat protein [Polyangiales bacterium]
MTSGDVWRHSGRAAPAGVTALLLGTLVACSSSNSPPVELPATGAPASTAGTAAGGTAGSSPSAAGGAPARVAGQTASAPVAGSSPGDVPTTPPAGAAGTVAAAGSGGAPAAAGTGAPTTPPAAGGSADWTRMGYDVGSTYFNSAEKTLTKDNAGSLEVAWTAAMGGNVYGAALQVGDKMYATAPGSVRAFEAATGKELWKTNVASTSTLGYANGKLFLNSGTGKMVSFDAADGKMLWSMPHSTQSSDGSSSAIPIGDYVIVGGSSGSVELSGGTGGFRGYVSALDLTTGETKWTGYTVPENATGASLWSSVSADLTLGHVYAGTGNNYNNPATDTSDAIIAMDLKTGEIKWKKQCIANDTFPGGAGPDSDFGANPVVYDAAVGGTLTKLIADGAKGGTVHSINRETGTEVWMRKLCSGTADGSSGIFTNFGWTGENLVVACNESGAAVLYGLDGGSGDIKWMRTLPGRVWGRTAFANGVGFVGAGTKLEVFDVSTGALIKSFDSMGGTIASTITVANGRVAFGEGLSWLSNGTRGTTLTVLAIK